MPPLSVGRLPEELMYQHFWEQIGDLQDKSEEHTAPNLRKLQARFMAYIRHPEGIDTAKEHIAPRDPDFEQLRTWIAGPDEAFAARRLSVYGVAYLSRLYEVLRDFFPRLVEVMDDASFHNMVVDYLLVYPPSHSSVHMVGKRLSQFLREYPRPNAPHWLPDLAALEWTRVDQFCQPNHDSLTQEMLAAYPPETWGEMRFEISPACERITLQSPVYSIWRALIEETELPDIPQKACDLLVWRRGFTLNHESLTDVESRAFQVLEAGEDFNTYCEVFLLEEMGDQEELTQELLQSAVQKAYASFGRWLAEGIFVSMRLPDPEEAASTEE
ncbi:MAG: putative DNA-binding domain-containing protein [Myxococcales bacterium]|nr:putative DNA-binding domain-containing protein [Myxococcales bacterium]MCB9644642.1 putative DNA-binding domain-containing protein [Myxococcales bacterium]